MHIEEIAQDLVTLCAQGRFTEAIVKHYAEDIVSEDSTSSSKSVGLDTVTSNDRVWLADHEIHELRVEGPFLGADKFAVRYICDVTFKPEARRYQLDELSLYTIVGGKIVKEQVFSEKDEQVA